MAERIFDWVVVLVFTGLIIAFGLAVAMIPVAVAWVLYNVGVWFGG